MNQGQARRRTQTEHIPRRAIRRYTQAHLGAGRWKSQTQKLRSLQEGVLCVCFKDISSEQSIVLNTQALLWLRPQGSHLKPRVAKSEPTQAAS